MFSYQALVFTQYQVAQSDFELDKLIMCRSYFSHRDRREHRGEIFDYFLNLCVSVRYNLFALPLYIKQLRFLCFRSANHTVFAKWRFTKSGMLMRYSGVRLELL